MQLAHGLRVVLRVCRGNRNGGVVKNIIILETAWAFATSFGQSDDGEGVCHPRILAWAFAAVCGARVLCLSAVACDGWISNFCLLSFD